MDTSGSSLFRAAPLHTPVLAAGPLSRCSVPGAASARPQSLCRRSGDIELELISDGGQGSFVHENRGGEAACLTEIGFGRRNQNEDGVMWCERARGTETLLVSADGMGGQNGGRIAADTFLHCLGQALLDGWTLETALAFAPRALYLELKQRIGNDSGAGEAFGCMGLTYAAAAVAGDAAQLYYQGDNKILHVRTRFWRRHAHIVHATSEDTAGEVLVRSGAQRESIAPRLFNQVTNYVGLRAGAVQKGAIHKLTVPLLPGDWLLGADDGLFDALCPPAQPARAYHRALLAVADLVASAAGPQAALGALRRAWQEAVCTRGAKDDNVSIWVYRHRRS